MRNSLLERCICDIICHMPGPGKNGRARKKRATKSPNGPSAAPLAPPAGAQGDPCSYAWRIRFSEGVRFVNEKERPVNIASLEARVSKEERMVVTVHNE